MRNFCGAVAASIVALVATNAHATFLQTDPIGYKDDMNLYAYVGNDPVNRSDPTGLAGCGTQSTGDRQALSGSECKSWEAKQEQGKKDVAATKGALAAYRSDPNSTQGKAFSGAMTKAFGEGGLSAGNLAKLDKALGKLEGFYNDPGTAQGGKYDVYKASDWSNGGTIRGGQVAFGTGFFSTTGTYSRMATVHEPMHLPGFQMGRDMQMQYPNGYYYGVYGPGAVQSYGRSNPGGAQNNIDSWACVIARAC